MAGESQSFLLSFSIVVREAAILGSVVLARLRHSQSSSSGD